MILYITYKWWCWQKNFLIYHPANALLAFPCQTAPSNSQIFLTHNITYSRVVKAPQPPSSPNSTTMSLLYLFQPSYSLSSTDTFNTKYKYSQSWDLSTDYLQPSTPSDTYCRTSSSATFGGAHGTPEEALWSLPVADGMMEYYLQSGLWRSLIEAPTDTLLTLTDWQSLLTSPSGYSTLHPHSPYPYPILIPH